MTQTRRSRLVGQYPVKIDEKGRMVLPSQFRERFADSCVLAFRVDHLGIYEGPVWDAFLDQLDEKVLAKEIPRRTYEILATHAGEVTPDSAGRILVPAWMRSKLDLDRDALITGHGKYLGVRPPDYVENIPDSEFELVAQALDSM